MRTHRPISGLPVASLVLLMGVSQPGDGPPPEPDPDGDRPAVLVFTKTAGFRHPSIGDGIRAIRELGRVHDFHVEETEDSGVFTPESLAMFDAVVFLSTTGDVLDAAQEAAFEAYIRGGGGFVGVHAAADTEYDWPFYGELVGAHLSRHSSIQPAKVIVETGDHPATRGLPSEWTRTDEWYNYRSNPRAQVRVLLSLDESSYEGGTMGDHPIAWWHDRLGGRAVYTGLGHTRESYREAGFLSHLGGAILWAAGEQDEAGEELGPREERVGR